MPNVFDGHEFEALKTRFEDQVKLLLELTKIDLQVFTGYITIQLILAGWLAERVPDQLLVKAGLQTVDLALTAVAAALLWNNMKRRKEVVGTVMNLNEALGYSLVGAYLKDRTINAPTKTRFWWPWYLVGVTFSFLGVSLILLGAPPREKAVPTCLVVAAESVLTETPSVVVGTPRVGSRQQVFVRAEKARVK